MSFIQYRCIALQSHTSHHSLGLPAPIAARQHCRTRPCRAVAHQPLTQQSSSCSTAEPADRPATRQQSEHEGNSACSPAAVLGLGQLATPSSLQTAWQQDVLPACITAWQEALQYIDQLQQQLKQTRNGSVLTLQQVEQVLLQLDAVLGTCQQVSLDR